MTPSEWVFEPKDFIRSMKASARRGSHRIRIPSAHAMVFGGDAFEVLRAACRAQRTPWDRSYATGHAGRRPVGIHRVSIGAPGAVLALEEAAVLGARNVLAFGSCGSLVPDLPIGSLVVPTRAYSDEGTSRHYGGPRWSLPDSGLSRALLRSCERRGVAVRRGGIWTTDAPYRESRTQVRALSAQGIVGVEMEASALFTVARFRKVRLAGLLVVSDELGGDSWNPGFFSSSFAKAERDGLGVVLDVLSGRLP